MDFICNLFSFYILLGYLCYFVPMSASVPWEWDWQWPDNWDNRPEDKNMIIDGKDEDGHKPICANNTLLQCWRCIGADSDDDCVRKGRWEICMPGETCYFDKRWQSADNTFRIGRGCIPVTKCQQSTQLKPKCKKKKGPRWSARCRLCGEGAWFRCRTDRCPGRYMCRKCNNSDSKQACQQTGKYEVCHVNDPVCEETTVTENGKTTYSSQCRKRLDCYNQPGLLPYCHEPKNNKGSRVCVKCSDIDINQLRCLKCNMPDTKGGCLERAIYEECNVPNAICEDTIGWNRVTGETYFSSHCISEDQCPNVASGDIACGPSTRVGVTECKTCPLVPHCSPPHPITCKKCAKADGSRRCRKVEECYEGMGNPICKVTTGWDTRTGETFFSSECSTLDQCPREDPGSLKCDPLVSVGVTQCTQCKYRKVKLYVDEEKGSVDDVEI